MASGSDLMKFCSALPKIELHAHISGSCSDATIKKLLEKYKEHDANAADILIEEMNHCIKDIDHCMHKFSLLHKLVKDVSAVNMVTRDVIEEFAADNVKYLELRTTLRDVPETGMTKASHLKTVLQAIQESKSKYDMIVRLILSIDRRMSLEGAWETLELAISNQSVRDEHGPIIVGIDLSGSPTAGDAKSWMPIFSKAKSVNLKLALHLTEVTDIPEEETRLLLSALPDRIGHGTFLTESSKTSDDGLLSLAAIVQQSRTPIECCLTSNLLCGTVKSAPDHHLGFWLQQNHPCIICTDDKGVFSTTLSLELCLAATTFNLDKKKLWQISYDSIEHIFTDSNVKSNLRDKFNSWKESHDIWS